MATQDELRKKYESQFTVNQLSPEEIGNYRNTITATNRPLIEAFSSGIASKKALNEQGFKDVESRLREREAGDQAGLAQDLTNRGFLRSGEQVGRGQSIKTTLTNDLNRADIQRAVANADLVLQEAGYTADINKGIEDQVERMSEREYNRRQTNASSAQQAYQFESGILQKDIDREMERGLQEGKLTEIDLGDRVSIINAKGQVVQTYPKGQSPGTRDSGSGSAGFDVEAMLRLIRGEQGGQQGSSAGSDDAEYNAWKTGLETPAPAPTQYGPLKSGGGLNIPKDAFSVTPNKKKNNNPLSALSWWLDQ